ncbi:MAG: magnesium chelatase [Chloroflexota bacterium]|nr:AAA family ATPase [Dehalococcoidia bacterium]MDW8253393.1 magnesium chelatase [Chloroflexota bacterium]
MTRPTTLGQLRASGYQPRSVKEEMRNNLIAKLRAGETLFPGIYGYEETVIPQIESAILSGHDIVLLGERGQAKTRIARSLVQLLDEEIPAIADTELHEDPFNPITAQGRRIVEEMGDDTPIVWIPRDRRYGEKLATPDTTIADLIGEVDPIKVAEGRYLSDEYVIHYGLIPRTNRGIFCINELPDLAERIQVGLLNIMEERDVQIRGYKIRLPLDLFVVASANPEDYTNRGRIITPLKDRFGSQIRTHYPRTLEHEIDIMEAERQTFPSEGYELVVPRYMKEIIAEFTHLARKSPDISQRSGVSARVSISNYENLLSSAFRRSVRLGERQVTPRISDLPAILASTTGKIELESSGDQREEKVVDKLIQGAILNVWKRYFLLQEFDDVIQRFENGLTVEVSDSAPSMSYVQQLSDVQSLKSAVAKLGATGSPASIAAAVEFILEGLHLNRKLNKDRVAGALRYRR